MDFSLLTQLTEAPAIPGREERVRELVSAQFSDLCAEINIDAMGNLIGHIGGQGPRVVLMAHMDEIGFMVSKIEKEGFIRVMPVGGIDPQVFGAQKVIVHGREQLAGVVGSVPPHLRKTADDKKRQSGAAHRTRVCGPGIAAGKGCRPGPCGRSGYVCHAQLGK
jgi:tetrahedral aminopeptidase